MPQDEEVPDGSGTGWAAVNWANAQLAGSGAGSGVPVGYVLDPERAQATINELTRITNEVRGFLTRTTSMWFVPPGNDEVSVNLAHNGAVMAGRAEHFMRSWASQIEAVRDALQAQLDGYRQVEDANRDLLT